MYTYIYIYVLEPPAQSAVLPLPFPLLPLSFVSSPVCFVSSPVCSVPLCSPSPIPRSLSLLNLPLSVSLYLSLSLSLSLSLCLSLSLSVFLSSTENSLSVFLSSTEKGYPYSNLSTGGPSLSLSLSLSLSVFLSLSLSLSLSVAFSVSVSFSDSGSVSLSLSFSLSVSSLSLSFSLLPRCPAPSWPWTVCLLLAVPMICPWFPLHFLFAFRMMSWSCPFHSFQLPLHVPVIFSVCPLHFPCASRSFVASHFPTSPVVPIGFLVLCFPFIPPALPLFSFLSLSCPFQFSFVSLHFLLLSCHVDFLFPPLISLHFLAFPLCSQYFPQKNTVFPAKTWKTQSFSQIFGKRRQETQTSKEPATGFEPGTPVLRWVIKFPRVKWGTPPPGVSSILSEVSDTPLEGRRAYIHIQYP